MQFPLIRWVLLTVLVCVGASPALGAKPVCGDGVLHPSEDCDGAALDGATCTDFGYDGGTLSCDGTCSYDTSGCTTDPVCGDGVVEGAESCDGSDLAGATCTSLGYDAGTLSCAGDCSYDTSSCETWTCGDGAQQGDESCDGSDLAGATCTDLGYDGGTLSCDGTCSYDTSGCTTAPHVVLAQVAYDTPGTDSVEEFVDLYNPTGASVSLDGWVLADGSASWSLPSGTSIAAGGYLSVARDAAGFEALYGLTPDVDGMPLSLNNDGDVLVLYDASVVEIDRVAWEDYETGWSIVADTGDSIERTDPAQDTDSVTDWSVLSPAAPYGGALAEQCGDGVVEGDESCDGSDLAGATCTSLGYDAGTLSCAGDCSYDTSSCETWTCGDGTQQGSESCDGSDLAGATCTDLGYDGGTLSCDGTCTYDTSGCTTDPVCGDGTAEGTESCDGSDLAGATCTSLGYDDGTLSCTGDCSYDTSSCETWTCGDGAQQGSESCDGSDLAGATCTDLGYDGGTLSCDGTCSYDTSGCTTDPVCGDGTAEGTESCDGSDLAGATCTSLGYDGGTLSCDGTCSYDTSGCTTGPVCGDGVVEGDEECDGSDLGGDTCSSLGYDGGTLSCHSDCTLDGSACTSSDPFCGDLLVNGAYEECDGTDDSACPGACSAHCACPATTGTGDLELHVVDVGQGDGLVLVSPDGFVTVVDAGTESQGQAVLDYLASIGISSVDYTLVSHMDADHIGGMDLVLSTYPEIVASFDHGGSKSTIEYSEYDAAAGTRRQALVTGQSIDLGPSVTADVLHSGGGSSLENNNSLVVRVTHGNVSYLLGGDCEEPCEDDYDPGQIDVYKVHHHGSSTSTSEALVQQMTPDTALISCGVDNPFGHPHQQTLDTLYAHGADIWRTDLDGDLEIIGTSTSWTVNGFGVCFDGETRSCGITDVGACSYGTQDCVDGAWGECTGQVDPVPEDCDNGIDDDCDGTVDDGDLDCATPPDHVVVAQVGYDTPGTDSVEEFVDLYNPTDTAASVEGWTLSDNVGSWSLPAGTSIPAHSYLTVARDAAGFQSLYGLSPDVEGMTLGLNNGGDQVVLRDGGGLEIDRVAWEDYEAGWSITAPTGDSIERANPYQDTDNVVDWSVTSPATPRGGF